MGSLIAAVVSIGALVTGTLGAVPASGPGQPAQRSEQRYIVVLDDSTPVPEVVDELLGLVDDLLGGVGDLLGVDLDHVFSSALNGFSASLTPAEAEALASHPRVRSVEADQVVQASAQDTPTGVDRVGDPDVSNATIPNLSINGADDQRVGADIAVIDTGIASHADLNIVARVDCAGLQLGCTEGAGTDGNGHGTHVAGSAAAIDNDFGVVGVAPGARLWSVKSLADNGAGSVADVIAGLDYVTARAGTIEIVNLSLGCLDCVSAALSTAITNTVNAGVVVTAAAGNEGVSASRSLPGNHPDVVTVSALADFDGVSGGTGAATCRSDGDDTAATFTNRGNAVEVIAPGTCVLSTLPGGGYGLKSGTSQAAGYVAGAAALLAARSNPDTRSGVLGIRDALVATGNFNWTDDSGDAVKEPLLDLSGPAFSVAGTPPPPPPNVAPVARRSITCVAAKCTFNGSASTDSDGTIASYRWLFGDGTQRSAQTARHTYVAAGTYVTKLIVTDDDGATAKALKTVVCSSGGAGLTCRRL